MRQRKTLGAHARSRMSLAEAERRWPNLDLRECRLIRPETLDRIAPLVRAARWKKRDGS